MIVDGDAAHADPLAAARPVIDPLAIREAQQRVAAALFGGPRPVAGLGRFRILERLGAGGMGVVYAAYDPDLDRGVALKLVRVPARGRDAALAEAKALARLSHPNVVPVHDAGVVGERVYIVMELVRGESLRRWVDGRDRREVLRAYLQVGEGLAAAHAAGLVHRDVKPDNAIVGGDGRVRVVDFGLACEVSEDGVTGEPATVAGTPRYMAPEQAAGAPVTAAADQYAFCVALAEALGAEPPLPRWLDAVLARGQAREPSARFPSMRELLRALSRDPARIARRRAAVALLVAVGAVAFLAGRATPVAAPCDGGAAALSGTWSPADRREALRRVASGDGVAVARHLDAQLRAHTAAWIAGHRDACLVHRRGAQSADLRDRRMACLARGRAALGAARPIVEAAADANRRAAAALAVAALPDPAACGDLEARLADPALPATAAPARDAVERARVQVAAGAIAEARVTAAQAVAAARAIDSRWLTASALVAMGRAFADDAGAAEAALAEATTLALAAGDDALAIEAWSLRVALADGPLSSRDVLEALATRAPPLARARFHRALATAALRRGERATAVAELERGLVDARQVGGPDALEMALVRVELARLVDGARRRALLDEAEPLVAGRVGADHPRTRAIRAAR